MVGERFLAMDKQIRYLQIERDRYREALRTAHECIVVRAGVRNNEKDAIQDREEIDKAINIIEQVLFEQTGECWNCMGAKTEWYNGELGVCRICNGTGKRQKG